MATKMSFNYFQSQNGKFGATLTQGSTKDMEVSQDLHLKMSKKIAQLTKVIYALNTKNDEHESIVQNLKENHEDEMQQLLSETKKKITIYQSQVVSEVESKKRIESLETTIVQYQHHQEQALTEFQKFKCEAEDELCNLKKEHAEKMLEISQNVLSAKKEFAENVDKFGEFRRHCGSNQQREIDELIKKQEVEIESVRNFQGSQNEEMLQEVSRTNEKHKFELDIINKKYEQLHMEKLKSEEDFDLKLQKAQAFYEKELEVLKNEQTSSQDNIVHCLKEQQDKLRKDFSMQETELKKQIDGLIYQLADSEDSIEKYQKEINQLETSMNNTDGNSQRLMDQLKDLEEKLSSSSVQVSEKQSELSSLNLKYSQKSSELEQKTALLSQSEESKLRQGEIIQDLETKMNMLQSRIVDLESERNHLHSQKENLSHQQLSQLKSLQQSLEDLNIEKQTMQQRYEREIQGLKDRHGNTEHEQEERHVTMLNDVRTNLEDLLKQEKTKSAETLSQTKQDWQNHFDVETLRLREEKEAILTEFERVKAELFSKLKMAEDEVKRLENSVNDSQQGLGSATSHINNLKEAASRLKSELDNIRVEFKTAKTTSTNLQAQIDKLKIHHESQMAESELGANVKLESLRSELDSNWAETLKNETKKLRKQITEQYESEKNSAILQLTLNHEKEVTGIIAEWEMKMNTLNIQISDLHRSANKSNLISTEEIQLMKDEMIVLEKKLREEMLEAGSEYARKISVMESAQENQLKSLIEGKDQEYTELEKKLKNKHIEDTQIQLLAHRAAVQNIQEQADKLRHDREATLIKQHQQNIDKLRLELSEKLETEVERVKKSHMAEIQAARIELERAIEISKNKDRNNASRIEELQNEITKRERTIRNLEDDVRSLQRLMEQLKRDIKDRDKEIKQIQHEAKKQIKQLEEDFEREYQRNIDNLHSDHLREIQEMVAEFNKAQELLKDKISSVQIQLEEAEERYRNRESRPEDLELIMQLRDAISERELRVRELIDEKRFYQLELVNRETNFNKIFNTTPNIGVLNPLNVKSRGKKGDKAAFKHSSAPSLSQRLEPLPNSPLHDGKLNPTKPLPMPAFTKKFVK